MTCRILPDERSNEPGEETSASSFTIATGEVVNNIDATGRGRIQVRLPWLRGTEPWARVVMPGAGADRGMYVLPHNGDEVLVAFNRSDSSDCFIIGGLWNMSKAPPRGAPQDPTTKMVIRSATGHDLEFDDLTRTISVTNADGLRVELSPLQISIATSNDEASITLDRSGNVTIKAAASLALEATKIDIKATAGVAVSGGATCEIKAPMVRVN